MMPRVLRMLALAGALAGLTACKTTINEAVDATDAAVRGYTNHDMMIIAAMGAAAFYVIDPLAPNWEVSRQQVSDTRFRIELRMKRFHTGGEGEAEPLFTRHAEELVEQLGAGNYRLLRYNEGIDSEVTVPRRWARGVIELLPVERPARVAARKERTAAR